MGAAGGATGMILGGILTAALGWEWIFFINLPIGLGAAIAAPGLLPADSSSETGKKLDLAGALTITLALGLLIFALNSSEQASFPIGLFLGLLAVAGILLVAFVVIERRTSQPLVAFRLFRLPGVTGANLAALLLNAIIASELFFTTLYLQQVLGLSALATGIAFLPNSALVLVGSALASRLVNRFGAGLTLAAGALILGVSAFLLSGVTAGGSYLINVMPGFTLTGLGLGLTFVALTISATSGVEERDQGLASGVVNTAIQLGSGVGIAAVVAVALALSQTSSGSMSARLVASYATGYLIDMVLALLIAVLALLLVHRHSRR
nr:MFS transporter [Ktedonosporobacter rubrisoli]